MSVASMLGGLDPSRFVGAITPKACGSPHADWHSSGGRLLSGGEPDVTVVRVLLVDDQAPFLRAMSAVVEETDGFEVVGEATTGEASLRAVAELLPDLVLMDVNLPGIDGLEATRRLRRQPSPPVVLLLSTYDEDAGAHFVAECGAAAYVTKSAFGPELLGDVWTAASR